MSILSIVRVFFNCPQTPLYIGRVLDPSFRPYSSEGRRGLIGEERGLIPREEIERVHLKMREVDIHCLDGWRVARLW